MLTNKINIMSIFSLDMKDVSDKTPARFDGSTFLRIKNKKSLR